MNIRLGTNLISILIFAILWEVAGRTLDSVLIPPLSKIGSAWLRLLASGKLLDNLMMSLGTLAAGFFLALIVGILLDVLIERFHEVEHFFDLYINDLMSAPDRKSVV